MSISLAIAGSLLAATLGQDIPVPPVTTASPGGYANPLQLDTDRYKRSNQRRTPRQNAPHGLCNGAPLSQDRRAELEQGYRTRAQATEIRGFRWLREQCGPNEAWAIQRDIQRRSGRR